MIRPTKKQMEYINKIKQVIGEERLHNYLVRQANLSFQPIPFLNRHKLR